MASVRSVNGVVCSRRVAETSAEVDLLSGMLGGDRYADQYSGCVKMYTSELRGI